MKPFKNYILTLYLALLALSSNAQFIWQTTLGTNGTDVAKDFIYTSDGNYLALGLSSGASPAGLYLTKIDTAGVKLWEKWYLTIGGNGNANVQTICETSDSGFIMGTKIYNGSGFDSFFIRLDANGDTLNTFRDSTNYGNNVIDIKKINNQFLLARVEYKQAVSLIKFDTNFNVLNRIDSITKPIKELEIINNTIYVLLNDSINNLLMINSNLTQIDTVTLPVLFPFFLRSNFMNNKLIIFGRDITTNAFHKIIYADLLGNSVEICDSIPNVFNNFIDDFKPIDSQDHLLFASRKYIQQFGYDIQLFFTDKCGAVQFDTILPRWSFTEELHEQTKRVLVDADGNYLVYGNATNGPLGGNDIFLFKFKHQDFTKSVDEPIDSINNQPIKKPTLYPNPFEHQFTLVGAENNALLRVTDLMGRTIAQYTTTASIFTVNTNSWAKGLYIVTIKGSTTTTVFKVVKQ